MSVGFSSMPLIPPLGSFGMPFFYGRCTTAVFCLVCVPGLRVGLPRVQGAAVQTWLVAVFSECTSDRDGCRLDGLDGMGVSLLFTIADGACGST